LEKGDLHPDREVASGLYIYTLELADGTRRTGKVVVLH
jgi:hypothetical protein